MIGNDTAIAIGGMQGHFELNVFVPLMARTCSIDRLLAAAARLLDEKCVDGIEANREQSERYAESTLSSAPRSTRTSATTAREIVKEAASTGRSLREVARERACPTTCSTRRSTTARWRTRTARGGNEKGRPRAALRLRRADPVA